MGLQVRLRHALGDRLIELTERSVEQPLVVGRAKDADVKVPSVTVANQHCALFVHEGQWVLQDMSGGSTFLNGNALDGATPLAIGDAIVLGSDANPATIEIDPAAAAQGYTGHPAVGTDVGPAAPAAAPPQIRQQSAPAANYYAGPAAAPPQIRRPQAAPAQDAWGNPVTTDEDPFAAWSQPGAAASATATPTRRKKPAKNTSEGAMMAGIILCVAIIGGTGWYAYQVTHRPPPVAPPPPEAKYVPAPKAKDVSIFVERPDDGTNPKGPFHPAPPPEPTPEPTPKESAPAPDPDSDSPTAKSTSNGAEPVADATWAEVQNLQFSPNYAVSILKYEDYKHQHAGLHVKELTDFVDQAVDHLWWKRIQQLCLHRDDLKKQMRKKDIEIKQQPAGDFLKTLKTEKAQLQANADITQKRLTDDMGYTADETPDAGNEDAIAKLRPQRDADKFGAWKVRLINFIKAKHGATPWDGED